MHVLSTEIIEAFRANRNSERAELMAAYMKDNFAFYGIMSPVRKELAKASIKNNVLKSYEALVEVVEDLYAQPERECHYTAVEIFAKYKKLWNEDTIDLIEFVLTQHAWWDTVDLFNNHVVGKYFLLYPKIKEAKLKEWLVSKRLWLERSTIIFQLMYREKTDLVFLTKAILTFKDSSEFFLQKAIGWSLRELGKRNPTWVKAFLAEHTLKPLSVREAKKSL
jgi:3-methyladenine DNA glycosylase AlkD